MKPLLSPAEERPASVDLAWRVLALANLFRLLAPLLLGVLFLTISPSPVGHVRPPLFIGAAAGHFLYAVGSIFSIMRSGYWSAKGSPRR